VIVNLIGRAIADGRLPAGARLPTHRSLAGHLGIAIGTVTRAYSEAERLGLVVGEVGRGTYVARHATPSALAGFATHHPVLDLTISRPPNEPAARPFAHALRLLSKRRDASDLLGNEPPNGWLRHRIAASKWISRHGVVVSPERVVACNGVQHALSVVFAALGRAGDTVATEELNYPGIRLLANLYGIRLVGVPMDNAGMRADALDRLCERESVKFLVCSPTMHNPTAVSMPLRRRTQIADVARRRGLTIVENDILGMMPPEPFTALATLAPERCCYITGLTKLVATGLRLAFIAAPAPMLGKLMTAFHSTTWMPPPLMSEIFTLLVEDGSIDTIIERHRVEAATRANVALSMLKRAGTRVNHASYSLWLGLPEPWHGDAFMEAARLKGVLVMPASAFAVGRHARVPQAVRLSLGGMNDQQNIYRGLRILSRLLTSRGRA